MAVLPRSHHSPVQVWLWLSLCRPSHRFRYIKYFKSTWLPPLEQLPEGCESQGAHGGQRKLFSLKLLSPGFPELLHSFELQLFPAARSRSPRLAARMPGELAPFYISIRWSWWQQRFKLHSVRAEVCREPVTTWTLALSEQINRLSALQSLQTERWDTCGIWSVQNNAAFATEDQQENTSALFWQAHTTHKNVLCVSCDQNVLFLLFLVEQATVYLLRMIGKNVMINH